MDEWDIRELGKGDREALLRMYQGFEPLGVAQGLPPVTEEARRDWIDRVLVAGLNLGVYTPDRKLVGHTILAPGEPGEAEIAFFVHQDYRQKRLGTRLVDRALERSREMDLRRVWASIYTDNVPALRLLRGRGFTPFAQVLPTMDLELFLPRVESAPRPA